MISLILYGRNDSYGYNLHKRAAISLNCMAEVLTAPGDEILFVDYNTPDDFPTFPEAIADTLTDRAKELLRIFRVRPVQHEPFRSRTSLVALEPIARNVALRRSNPENRWVLSTNTDMVFVTQHGKSLSDIFADAPDAYYPLPRFEVPETLWESADRLDPKGTIAAFGAWGRAYHLNEIVLSSDPTVMYDAPGDFQLALRSDLWRMHGFHEGMLLGWHVDSNFAKRISLLGRKPGNVLDDVFGYHCDHTRQVTPAHRPRAVENDLQTFFADVSVAEIPEQAETWGLAGQSVEELSVTRTSKLYLAALDSIVPAPLNGVTPRLAYDYANHNLVDYAVDHVLPFIADAFASYPRSTKLGWFGGKRSLLERFAAAWSVMGFSEDILVWDGAHWLGSDLPEGCARTSEAAVAENSDVFVFDFGRRDGVDAGEWDFRTDAGIVGVARALRATARVERERMLTAGSRPRRFIGVNAVCNDVEPLFHDLVGAARTPIATRIRQGYVHERPAPGQELPLVLHAGSAGQKMSSRVVSRDGLSGYVFYLPHLLLDEAAYRLQIDLDVPEMPAGGPDLNIEVISNSCLMSARAVTKADVLEKSVSLDFIVPRGDNDWPESEVRMRTLGNAAVTVRRVSLARLPESEAAAVSDDFDLLPLLSTGSAGTRESFPLTPAQAAEDPRATAIHSRTGAVENCVVFGPHVWLVPGHYELQYEFWSPVGDEPRAIEGLIEVASGLGATIHAEAVIDFAERDSGSREWRRAAGTLEFDIQSAAPAASEGHLEVRVWSEGGTFSLSTLRIHRAGDARGAEHRTPRLFGGKLDPTLEAIARRVRTAHTEHLEAPDVLDRAHVGPAGRRHERIIEALPGAGGIVSHGPRIWLLRGCYEVTFDLDVTRIDPGSFIRLEVATGIGNRIWAMKYVEPQAGRRQYALGFEIHSDVPEPQTGLLEFRVHSSGTLAFALMGVRVHEVDGPDPQAAVTGLEPLFHGLNILPTMQVGPAAQRTERGLEVEAASAGYVTFGPYLSLPAGWYEATFDFLADRVARKLAITVDVATGQGTRILAARKVRPHWNGIPLETVTGKRSGPLQCTLPFQVTSDAESEFGQLELRAYSPGGIPFTLTSVTLRRSARQSRAR